MSNVSLNADVEEGLSGDFIPLDDAKTQPTPPEQVEAGVKDVSLIENEPALLPAQLPNLATPISQLQDSRNHVADLRAVNSVIGNSNTIAQENAMLIDSVFTGFFGDRVSLREFTREPSKVNLEYSKRFMIERIAKEEAEVIGRVGDFFSTPKAELELFVTNMKNYYVPKLQDELVALKTIHGEVFERFETSKNTVVPTTDSQFVNLATTPIHNIDTTSLQLTYPRSEGQSTALNFVQGLEGLKVLLDTPAMGYFIQMAVEGRDSNSDQTWTAATLSNAQGSATITLQQLIKALADPILSSNIANMASEAEKIKAYFDTASEEVGKINGDFALVDQFIVCNVGTITQNGDRAHLLNKVAQDMILFNKTVHHVLSYLKFCL
jgi:hypothetical protein